MPKPAIASNMSNLEVAAYLESVFINPTEFMAAVLARFRDLAERESGEDEINGHPVPVSQWCPVCGVELHLTIAHQGELLLEWARE